MLSKAERVYGAVVGWDSAAAGSVSNRFPYPEEQAFGAFIAFALLALWRTAGSLRSRSRLQAPGSRPGKGTGEPLGEAARSHPGQAPGARCQAPPFSGTRALTAGLAVSLAIALAFLRQAGMSLGLGAAFLALTLLVATTLSRIRAE